MASSSRAQRFRSAVQVLTAEWKRILKEPIEGFRLIHMDDQNIFKWYFAMFGPPDSIYEGGYFKMRMDFPEDYPYKPPTLRFTQDFWHPNVYRKDKNHEVCISILMPEMNHELNGLERSECWNPTQNIRTILLSVLSMLMEPNLNSPANVDASKQYRDWQTKGSLDYLDCVQEQVRLSQQEAELDGVHVPTTLEEYCAKASELLTPGNKTSQVSDSDTDPLEDPSPPTSPMQS